VRALFTLGPGLGSDMPFTASNTELVGEDPPQRVKDLQGTLMGVIIVACHLVFSFPGIATLHRCNPFDALGVATALENDSITQCLQQ
jgi:hypothetical protein